MTKTERIERNLCQVDGCPHDAAAGRSKCDICLERGRRSQRRRKGLPASGKWMLRKCPWCASKPAMRWVARQVQVVCLRADCHCSGPRRLSTDAAADAWNRSPRPKKAKSTGIGPLVFKSLSPELRDNLLNGNWRLE